SGEVLCGGGHGRRAGVGEGVEWVAPAGAGGAGLGGGRLLVGGGEHLPPRRGLAHSGPLGLISAAKPGPREEEGRWRRRSRHWSSCGGLDGCTPNGRPSSMATCG